ncbi:hypothetical protein TELCIR_19791 [Teladorsagia circumcincta]|uniref:Uncharacterized protein n=1 Tax=Teladorsagia circumcincta TaxID=45464 RepID=A0A2G9TLB1_TELCI|nr:hypothetical protein TELCIR_19791 [Teladorsagia circumcincta]
MERALSKKNRMYVTELVAPNATLIPKCWKLWRETTGFESLTKYTLCCREALKNYATKNIMIYEKTLRGSRSCERILGTGWQQRSGDLNQFSGTMNMLLSIMN